MLAVRNVSKHYGDRFAALKDVSFQATKGEMLFITGASGAGKSTIFRLLYLEERPSSGRISVGAFNLNALTAREIPSLRRHIGGVFQDFRLIPERTVAANVALPLEVLGKSTKKIRERTDAALSLVGIWSKRNSYPNQLSGGEAQRAALARAIVNEPLVLLADEPTGYLDPKTAGELFELFATVNLRGCTILIATHDLSLAGQFGKRVLHLVSGTLTDEDQP